jgi:hypothetical protein
MTGIPSGRFFRSYSSLKERAGVKWGFGLRFWGGVWFGGQGCMARGGCPFLDWCPVGGVGGRVKDRAQPGRVRRRQASLMRVSASR